jgi:muramoyltetrapeptide carboxypeptidase
MTAKRIPKDGTIGLFCPSHVADMERYDRVVAAMKRLGFRVRLGANVQKDTYGYAASAEERAADLNALVTDGDVGLILFNGGDSAVEILPLIDYENIRRHPKLFASYSDGTSIVNAIYAQTGLVTYYGANAGIFDDLRHYDYMQFCAHFVEGYEAREFVKDSVWRTLNGGCCEGTFIGGYTSLFGMMLTNRYFKYNGDEKYLLLLESHEKFDGVGGVASHLAFIAQSGFMRNVAGLIVGHYSKSVPDDLLRCLERFGAAHGIPVVYTDDFGHGTRHGIFPIGVRARLDADKQELVFH